MSPHYVAWRLLQVVPAVAGILLVTFLLIHLAPGDPILALAGEHGDATYYEAMRERYGLDRSLPEQLVAYVGQILRGELGTSYTRGRPVTALIGERLPATLLLSAAALVISTVAGLALGVLASSRPGGTRDLTVNVSTLTIYAAPVFWIGQIALLTLALRSGVFPVQGMRSAGGPSVGPAAWLDVGRHLALPAIVLSSQQIAAVARLTRSGMLEQLGRDHVLHARARGLPEWRVLTRHALRPGLLPVVTVVGGRVGHLVSGAVIVEVIFGWPGIGRLLLTSMQSRDLPVVLGIFLVVSITVVVANLLTDLTYGWLDPRVSYR